MTLSSCAEFATYLSDTGKPLIRYFLDDFWPANTADHHEQRNASNKTRLETSRAGASE